MNKHIDFVRKWFECTAEQVEMIYQLIEAENAQDAERTFREMYPSATNVRIKRYEETLKK